MFSFLILIIFRSDDVFKMLGYNNKWSLTFLSDVKEDDWTDTANRARNENSVDNFNVCARISLKAYEMLHCLHSNMFVCWCRIFQRFQSLSNLRKKQLWFTVDIHFCSLVKPCSLFKNVKGVTFNLKLNHQKKKTLSRLKFKNFSYFVFPYSTFPRGIIIILIQG